MREDYVQTYSRLYLEHWWWRAREAVILETIRHYEPASGYGSILDVGCGGGWLLDRLRDFGAPEGIEPDASLGGPRRDAQGDVHVAPFDESFQPDKRYGLILMLDVLEHLDDPTAALRHARGLLAPTGRLILTVPAFNALWTRHDDINEHLRRYTRTSLRQLAAAAALQLDCCRYLFHWMFPAKLLVRVKERLMPARPDVPDVPSEPLNRLLYAGCRLEERFLGRARLPFGSSLLASGRARG